MGVVGVKFNNRNKVYYFDDNGLKLKKNLTVIVDTDKGLQFGTVASFVPEKEINDELEYRKVVRISTKKDYLQHLTNLKDANLAINKCKEMVVSNNLNMSIIDSYYNFDRSQLVFRFVADERVDFRQLARDLGSYFKTRIELRQIGIRDKAKEVGGLGPCGRKLCCSNFLKEFDSVSINMAKNQSLSLNPTKINGVCGRLLCCLKYENDCYTKYKEGLPEVGDHVTTNGVKGKVINVNLFKRKYTVLTEQNTLVEVEGSHVSQE